MAASTQPTQAEIDQIWLLYKQTGAQVQREELILHYAPLVKKVVGRMGLRPDGPIEWGDLLNYGVLGLIDAVERFEPDRGIAFQTFASLRIRGAVLDALRQIDPLGRLARRRVRSANEAIQRLTLELGRTPTDEEVATAVGLTLEQYDKVLQDASFLIVSLDNTIKGSGENQTNLADLLEDPNAAEGLDRVEERELRERLIHSIQALSQREQTLLSLYYFEGLTMREVADVMEISQTRVCQIHARTIMSLKAMIDPQGLGGKVEEEEPTIADPLPRARKTAPADDRRSPGLDRRRRRRRRWLDMFEFELGSDAAGSA